MPPKPTRRVPTGTLPRPDRRPWWEYAGGALAHLVVLLLALAALQKADLPRRLEEDEPPPPPAAPPIEIPLYVPPPPRPTPPPPVPLEPRVILPSRPDAAPSPAPPASAAPREERPNAPPEADKKDGVREPDERDPGEPAQAEKATAPKRTLPYPAITKPAEAPRDAAEAQEAEARRLFGTKRRADATDDPITVRPFALGPDGKPQQCEPLPKFERDSLGRAPMGTAVGRILRDDGRPLEGALLQMVGTQYVSFTDAAGEYRFTYDLSLIENCRTQYVRVSAKGFESRLLVLVVGARIRSEDVELRRNARLPFGIRPGN